MKFSTLVLVTAIVVGGLIYWSEITKPAHSILSVYPKGQDLAPNFRGIAGTYFKNKQNLWLNYESTLPENPGDAKGLVFIAPGYFDHAGTYKHLASSLSEKGYIVLSNDYQGFGRSEGDRGHTDDFTRFVDDFSQFVRLKKEEHKAQSKNTFCIGHGMGSIVVGQATKQNPGLCSSGIILSSPSLPFDDSNWRFGNWNQVLTLASEYIPKLPLINPISPDTFSKDPAVVKRLAEDQLSYRGLMRARLGYTLLRESSSFDLSSVDVPVLTLQGSTDKVKVLDVKGKKVDKEVIEGGYHNLFMDSDKEKVLKIVQSWIAKNTK